MRYARAEIVRSPHDAPDQVPDTVAMDRGHALDLPNRAIVLGAILTAAVTGSIGLLFDPVIMLAGAVAGAIPWVCLALLRPRILTTNRLPRHVAASTAIASLVGLGGIAWLVALTIGAGGSANAPWLAAGFAALAAAMAVGMLSRALPWLPAAVAILLIAGGIVALTGVGAWAASCPRCPVHEYHDPPTRAFMFVVYTIVGGAAASMYAGMLVLFAYAARVIPYSASGEHEW